MKSLVKWLFLPLVIFAALFLSYEARADKAFKKAGDYRANMPVSIVRDIPLPKWYHEGLFLSEDSIWVNNGRGGKIWVIDERTGKKTADIKSPAVFTEGITAFGDKYWMTDWDGKSLCLVRREGNNLVKEREISVSPAYPAGVVWNGSHLYVIIWMRGLGTRYYMLKMDGDGKLIERVHIKFIREPSQLAWDGQYLWISSWFDRRAYKVDASAYEIKGYFRTQLEKTTGIAWDGDGFWVTGTDEGLRRIELKNPSDG